MAQLRLSTRLAFLATLIAAPQVTAQTSGVALESYSWGFDGFVRPRSFNLLTLNLRNDSEKEYRGGLSLSYGSAPVSTEASTQVRFFLGAGEARRVQLTPWISNRNDEFSVRIFGQKTFPIDPGEARWKVDRPAAVVLREDKSFELTRVGLRSFPESRFPQSVVGTDGLSLVVLDHSPRFVESQRRAFLDWLRSGGALHLYQRGGSYPNFEGAMAVLNDPNESFAVGGGRVHRHAIQLGDAGKDDIVGLRGLLVGSYRADEVDRNADLLAALRTLVRPEHNWPLIYLTLTLFFVLAVPVHGVLSRRRLNYIASVGMLLGIVAVTTYLIYVIGARGYGEEATVHSVGHARFLSDGRFDVTQWKNVFVTEGGSYDVRHKAQGSTYSSGRFDTVSATVIPGRDARLGVELRVFSERPFLHRGVMQKRDLQVALRDWEKDRNGRFSARVESSIPYRKAWVFHGNEGALVSNDRTLPARSLRSMFAPHDHGHGGFAFQQFDSIQDLAEQSALRILADRWDWRARGTGEAVTQPDTARVVLLCESPKEFAVRGAELGEERGCILYEFDLPIQEK